MVDDPGHQVVHLQRLWIRPGPMSAKMGTSVMASSKAVATPMPRTQPSSRKTGVGIRLMDTQPTES